MKRMQTWRWVLAALLLALAVTARAWQPAGWTYWDWPWTYDSASGDWHWFAAGGAQWIYAYPPGTGWAKLPQSGIAQGWSFWNGEWAYDGDTGAWCRRNAGDTQWCVNMRPGQWARFGTNGGDSSTPVDVSGIWNGSSIGDDPVNGAWEFSIQMFKILANLAPNAGRCCIIANARPAKMV